MKKAVVVSHSYIVKETRALNANDRVPLQDSKGKCPDHLAIAETSVRS